MCELAVQTSHSTGHVLGIRRGLLRTAATVELEGRNEDRAPIMFDPGGETEVASWTQNGHGDVVQSHSVRRMRLRVSQRHEE